MPIEGRLTIHCRPSCAKEADIRAFHRTPLDRRPARLPDAPHCDDASRDRDERPSRPSPDVLTQQPIRLGSLSALGD